MNRCALAALLLALFAGSAPLQAIMLPAAAQSEAQRDAKRFGAARPNPGRARTQRSERAFHDFRSRHGARWRLRVDERTGAAAALVEGRTAPRRGAPEQISADFLQEARGLLDVDPAAITLIRKNQGRGMTHLLYQQTYKGLPVEFSRVKVHVAEDGSVIGANSSFEADIALDLNPRITAAGAAAIVTQDNGRPPRDGGRLVVFPDRAAGRARLAWKFTAQGNTAVWRYYVDAHDGAVIFRYNDLRFVSGAISGMVYPISPTESAPVQMPFSGQRVYVADGSNYSTTDAAGNFNNGSSGKIITSLQGPWVNVSNFRGPSAHYDNGSGVWNTVATPAASPHPYPANSVSVSTIDISALAPNAVKFLPIFSNFTVGSVTSVLGYTADITDDDQVSIHDSDWKQIAGYVGDRGAFNGAAVHGQKLFLKLRSNSSDNGQYGYTVALSSYLALTDAPTVDHPGGADLVWQPQHTSSNRRSEINLFYHINRMHDYFMSDINQSNAAGLGEPVSAMALVGPGLDGAFYNPLQDNLSFGDGGNAASPSDILTDDATVPSHEYTHYVLEKIWPIINFGQSGSISEAMADYFAGSSLDRSAIGKHYNAGTPLRELNCQANPPCRKLDAVNWGADLYYDSLVISQSLWELRAARIAAQGAAAGRSCADGLAFQSLLFFPESFSEFLDAIKRVAADSRVPACGGDTAAQLAAIDAAFTANHGLAGAGLTGGDALEGAGRNDGPQTATDVSTRSSISATIYPAGDMDYYTFGAGPGPIRIGMRLPEFGGYYKGYALVLYDRNHVEVARAEPPYDGSNTLDGLCQSTDCNTTAANVTLTYINPGPDRFFLQVAGGISVDGSNSGVNDDAPYALGFTYPEAGAFTGAIVSAAFDRDRIDFSVDVTSFPRTVGPGGSGGQDYFFAYAQLRDHARSVLPLTDTRLGGTSYLAPSAVANNSGKISGRIDLQNGFAARYPAAGSVYLEVFGYNVQGSTVSLGLSPALYLTAAQSALTAYNNVFNPKRGEKATFKYEILSPGHVTLKLFTLHGTLVRTLLDEDRPAGKGSVDWYGANMSGNTVASGIYLLDLKAPGIAQTQKVVVVK
ncbi:MAG: hypothetical protein WC881_03785 [Elusimicrobiota bacterium]|jgi:Zn-dependent metalloprotease